MCVIVDVNVATLVLLQKDHPDFACVQQSILRGRLKVVHGGHLTDEYLRNNAVAQRIAELDRAGLAIRVSKSRFDEEFAKVRTFCSSDDPHIIALARASGARLLCS